MPSVTAVSQRYTGRGSGMREWCDGGRGRCQDCYTGMVLRIDRNSRRVILK